MPPRQTKNLSSRCGDTEKNKNLTTCHPEVPVKRARVFFSAIVGPRDLLRPKLRFDEDRYQHRMALGNRRGPQRISVIVPMTQPVLSIHGPSAHPNCMKTISEP